MLGSMLDLEHQGRCVGVDTQRGCFVDCGFVVGACNRSALSMYSVRTPQVAPNAANQVSPLESNCSEL